MCLLRSGLAIRSRTIETVARSCTLETLFFQQYETHGGTPLNSHEAKLRQRATRAAAKPVLLVTGFGPFEEYGENPSGDIAEAVHRQSMSGVRIVGVRLDVDWAGAWESIQNAVAEYEPNAMLCLGVAPNPFIRLDIMARNTALPCADIHGAQPPLSELLRIVPDAPPAYWTTLPVEWLQARLQERYLSATQGREEDRTAFTLGLLWPDSGWFLCNYVFFHVMHYLDHKVPYRGFVHLPRYPADGQSSGPPRTEVLRVGFFLIEELVRWLVENQDQSELLAAHPTSG